MARNFTDEDLDMLADKLVARIEKRGTSGTLVNKARRVGSTEEKLELLRQQNRSRQQGGR